MVTLTGLFFMMASSGVYLLYDTTLSKELPMWTHLLCAFCMFMYQTFDAVDGKQARRLSASSPLGQLFDHGCDAITTSLMVLMFSQAMRLGTRPAPLNYLCLHFGSGVSAALSLA